MIALVFFTGCLGPLQALINAKLGQYVNGPIFAAFINFIVGGLALTIVVFGVLRIPLPSYDALRQTKIWMWFAGFGGVMFVAVTALTVRKIGPAAMITTIIVAQLMASLLLDHYGILLDESRPITWTKFAGVILLFSGAYLVIRR